MTTIKPSFLYGVRAGVDDGVHFTGETTLLYPAGSGVAQVLLRNHGDDGGDGGKKNDYINDDDDGKNNDHINDDDDNDAAISGCILVRALGVP